MGKVEKVQRDEKSRIIEGRVGVEDELADRKFEINRIER